jgi:hypothetical protein
MTINKLARRFFPLLMLAASGGAHAASFPFSFDPDYGVGSVSGVSSKVEGFVENAAEGDNFNFNLTATITAAADPLSLGSGYNLLYLNGGEPAFRIQGGKVVFASAIFTRTSGDYSETLALYTSEPYTNLFRTNGTDYSGQFAEASPQFGDLVASAPSVPEPGTWVMLLAGFSLIGAALRYRRQAALASSA